MKNNSVNVFDVRKPAPFFSLAALAALCVILSAPARSEGQTTLTVPELIAKLKDKKKPTILAAAKALGDLGTPAKDATTALGRLLKDTDSEIQRQAARALAQIGPSSLPVLQKAVKDDQAQIRLYVAEALAILAPESSAATQLLILAAKDREPAVRINALQGLLSLPVKDERVATAFDDATKDDNPYISLLGSAGIQEIKTRRDNGPPIVLMQPFGITAIPRLTPAQENQLDRMVELFISYDTHGPLALSMKPLPPYLGEASQRLVLNVGPEGIPALVRGINKALAIQSSCPSGLMSRRLKDLVQQCNDPIMLDYVINNLGVGLPPSHISQIAKHNHIVPIRETCMQRKAELIFTQLAAERQAAIQQLVAKITELSDADLKAALSHRLADARLAALYVVAQKRLHCEDALIERLVDPDSRVTQLARQCLIRLARGTDFGPPPVADAADLLRSQARWKKWWQQQDRNPAPVKLVVVSEGQDDPKKLGAALDAAAAGDRAKLLAKLRDGDGIDYTTALAAAIGRLTDEPQQQARAALVERLGKLTAGAAREKLRDGDAEVRRAAAAACAAQADREFVPDLVGLLLDADPEVATAGRAALRTLTGEDFGTGRAAALKWRDWWAKKEKR